MKPIKNFFKDVRSDVKSEKGLLAAVRFVATFLVIFLLFLYVIIPLTSGLWDTAGEFHAHAVQGVLGAFGIESQAEGNVLKMEVQGEEVDFVISRLCSGDVEIALLVALLLASSAVLMIWRVLGSIIGVAFLFLMNPLRIALTLGLTKDSGMVAGDFYHSVIFRLFLFLLLVLYYFAWYHVFSKRKSKLQERICKRFGH